MSWIIVVAGVVGLAAVVVGFAELTHAAFRERDVVSILVAVAVAIVVVLGLIAFGDRLLE
jgi:NAD/NADP transhydrogenase beta subunit